VLHARPGHERGAERLRDRFECDEQRMTADH
jgi:hypothetical protein